MKTAKYKCEMNFDLQHGKDGFEYVPHKTTGTHTIRMEDGAHEHYRREYVEHQANPEKKKEPRVEFRCSHCGGLHFLPFSTVAFS